jgi:hypothetical protein
MQTRGQARIARGGIGDMRNSSTAPRPTTASDKTGTDRCARLRNRGTIRLGDKQGAIADFRKALELRPDLRTARDGLQKLGAL